MPNKPDTSFLKGASTYLVDKTKEAKQGETISSKFYNEFMKSASLAEKPGNRLSDPTAQTIAQGKYPSQFKL